MPDMSTEQRAYLAVGEFMAYFADMEFQLNLALRSLLNLGLLEASVITSNIDVRTKVYIVKTALNMRPITEGDWLKNARKELEAIVKVAEKRNILAHNSFTPREDGVEFFYVKAKGTLSLPDEIWSYETFDSLYGEMHRLRDAIIEMTKTLKTHPASTLLAAIGESFGDMDPALKPTIAQLLFGDAKPEDERDPPMPEDDLRAQDGAGPEPDRA